MCAKSRSLFLSRTPSMTSAVSRISRSRDSHRVDFRRVHFSLSRDTRCQSSLYTISIYYVFFQQLSFRILHTLAGNSRIRSIRYAVCLLSAVTMDHILSKIWNICRVSFAASGRERASNYISSPSSFPCTGPNMTLLLSIDCPHR